MSPEISERSFEEAIECALLQYGPDACAGEANAVHETAPPYGDTPPGGYRRRSPEDYDRTLCLLPRDVLDFVLATQPKEWKKLEQHHGAGVRRRGAPGALQHEERQEPRPRAVPQRHPDLHRRAQEPAQRCRPATSSLGAAPEP